MNKLISWQKSHGRKPLVLYGTRQVGKTWLLKEFGEKQFAYTWHLNFEQDSELAVLFEHDLKPERILQDLEVRFNRTFDRAADLLIFDEVQLCGRALTSLKYFCEDMPEIAIVAAGSLLGVTLSDVSFPVGKIDILHLYPLSFSEFLHGIGDFRAAAFLTKPDKAVISSVGHAHLWSRLKEYFITGGLPEVVSTYAQLQKNKLKAFAAVREKQANLIITYQADMAKHSGKINAMHIDRVWRNIPSQLAANIDGSAAKFKFKDVIPGISRLAGLIGPIEWLQAAGLVIKVPIVKSAHLPLISQTQENSFKLFIFDIGLLGAMAKLAPQSIEAYQYGTFKGYFAENFVAQALRDSGIDDCVCWQEGAAEIEFIQAQGDSVIPIEVKSGNVTKAKSLRVFSQKYSPPYSYILSAKPLYIDRDQAIRKVPLYLAGHLQSEY